MEREARHAWLAKSPKVAPLKACARSPSGCDAWQKRTGGCALRAYPRLISVHPGVRMQEKGARKPDFRHPVDRLLRNHPAKL